MRFLHHRPLALILDLLSTSNQEPNSARLRLALCHDYNWLPLLQLPAPSPFLVDALGALPRLRQPAARARQSGGHERGAREHESDGAAVDADSRESLRETVDELEVRDEGGVVLLVEEGLLLADEEGAAVGQLHLLERGLFGHHFFDVGV